MGIASIDSALRRGLGFAGKVIGTQFDVYRIGGKTGLPNAATSIIATENQIFHSFSVREVHDVPKVVEENTPLYDMLYIGMCDSRQLKTGDIFVEIGPKLADTPDGRVFALLDVQPLLPCVFARVEIMGGLSRPNGEGDAVEPILGLDDYQGETKFTEMTCSLNQGLYEIPGDPNIGPAVIPMGIQPNKRLGSDQEFKYPTATKRGLYFGYCPLLPGVQIQPGDVISDHNGNRYVVHIPTSFQTGLKGWFLQMTSLFT